MNLNDKKESKSFANFMSKAAEVSKKAAGEIQKGAKNLSEQTKKTLHEQKVKRYNPLFKENFESESFDLPNVIHIVDDAVRRDVDVCEGAIGWTDVVDGVEILHIYDKYVDESHINFIPFPKCHSVYCTDNFESNKYINSDTIFERNTNEKLAELEHIAYTLGAKSCSIEIEELDASNKSTKLDVSISGFHMGASTSNGSSTQKRQGSSGKNISYFEGHLNPQLPTLKWFVHDDSINNLIKMRCTDKNSIKSKVLELNCSSFASMSQQTASAIDKIIKTSVSLEKQAIKEHNSKLIYEIEF